MILFDPTFKIRPTRSITVLLLCVLPFFIFIFSANLLSYDILKVLTFVVLPLLTSGLLFDLIINKGSSKVKSPYLRILIFILSIFFGFWSSAVIGIQTQPHRDGAIQFGPPFWILALGYIYPFSFAAFLICLRLFNAWKTQVVLMFLWLLTAAGLAYLYPYPSNYDQGNSEFDYYYSSETELMSPIILIVVAVWSIYFIYINVKKTPGETRFIEDNISR